MTVLKFKMFMSSNFFFFFCENPNYLTIFLPADTLDTDKKTLFNPNSIILHYTGPFTCRLAYRRWGSFGYYNKSSCQIIWAVWQSITCLHQRLVSILEKKSCWLFENPWNIYSVTVTQKFFQVLIENYP